MLPSSAGPIPRRVLLSFFFFFSSRRRHTRCLSDWSSDVCSSDLEDVLHDRHGPRDDGLALIQHLIHLALADDLAQSRLGRLKHRVLGLAVVEKVVLGVLERVLDRKSVVWGKSVDLGGRRILKKKKKKKRKENDETKNKNTVYKKRKM